MSRLVVRDIPFHNRHVFLSSLYFIDLMFQELQQARFQWQNLTLYLAALCGSCIQTKPDLTILVANVAPKWVPDRIRAIQNALPLMEQFVDNLMSLLDADDMQIRDVVREALGSELSPCLYGTLIKHLET